MSDLKRTRDDSEVMSCTNTNSSQTTPENPKRQKRPTTLELPEPPEIEFEDSQIDVSKMFSQQITEKLKKRRHHKSFSAMTQAPSNINDSQIADDEPAHAGIIQKLELFNFMCHSAFSLDFGEQTNFIIGRNGAGKSAILTGISVALGAKASDTDRGNSLKDLIKHGKNFARAIVTLKNEGEEAFKPQEYGNKIIIERVLKADGTNSCNIKDSRGKVISNKKKTVDEILDYFAITIGNPMTILTQTEAKTFLAHSNDTDKFKNFMNGTRLQESYDNFEKVKKDVDEIGNVLRKNEDIYVQAKDLYKKAAETWNNFKDSEEFEKQRDALIGKKLWLHVYENEEKMEKAKALLKQKETTIEEITNKIAVMQQEITKLTNDQSEVKSGDLNDVKTKIRSLEDEKLEMQKDIKQRLSDNKSFTFEIKNIKSDIKQDQEALVRLEASIQKETARIEHSSEESIEKLNSFMDKQKTVLQTLSAKREELETEWDSKSEISKQENKNFTEALNFLKSEVDRLQNELREQSVKTQSRPEDAFSSNVASLIKDIRSNPQKFKSNVMGPLGLNIELKKEYSNWLWVLEALLQRQLGTFIVNNYDDSEVLKSRVKFFNTQSDITIRQPEVFDFSNSIPNGNYLSMLDVLKIADPNITCFLVDALKLQSTLLVPDRKEAERILLQETDSKISSIICFVPGNGALKIFKRNGVLQTDPIQSVARHNHHINLRTVGDSAVARIERDLKEAKIKYQDKDSEKIAWEKSDKNILNRLRVEILENKKESREINQTIEKSRNKLEQIEGGQGKLNALKEEKERTEASAELNYQRLAAPQKKLHEMENELKTKRQLYEKVENDYINTKKLLVKKEDEIHKIESQIEFHVDNINSYNTKINLIQSHIEKLSEFLQSTTEQISIDIQVAEEQCTREAADVESEDNLDNINAKIDALGKVLKEIEAKQGIDKSQAQIQLMQARENYITISNKYKDSVDLFENLKLALQARLENLTSTASSLIQLVNDVFENALRIRKFRGRIDFDFSKGKLSLKVSTKANESLRSVESFSGGEKSYAQISFLFAIWKPMQSRVRGLDEFDVFMDQINRRIALKLILDKVAENPKTQTIFITPLSVSNVEGLDSKSVHIHEMTPPERANI